MFVGDVARPDLAVEAAEGAAELFQSLARLLELPDDVQVFPGHIGGSLCGGARMSEAPGSTIGYERRGNEMLAIQTRLSSSKPRRGILRPSRRTFAGSSRSTAAR